VRPKHVIYARPGPQGFNTV